MAGHVGQAAALVAGPFVLASSAAFYGKDKPSTFADYYNYLSPWATGERIAREGMVVICEPGDQNLPEDSRHLWWACSTAAGGPK